MRPILFLLVCLLFFAMFCPTASAQCPGGRCPAVSAVEAPINVQMPDHGICHGCHPIAKATVSVLKTPIVVAHNSRQRRVERGGWYLGKWAGKLLCR